MLKSAVVAVAAGAAFASTALAVGPDVTLLDIQSLSRFGPVSVNGSNVWAFAIGSHTCNIGNQNLIWANSGTPGLAMNAYRLYDGRLVQIGLGNAKTACCAAAGSGGCGTCNGAGGSVLGAGCLDVYSSGWNAGQSRLAPRSAINATTGQFTSYAGSSGDAIFRRLQIREADMSTVTYPGALWFVEGVYVGTDDAANNNSLNNATYKRVLMSANNMTLTGSAFYQQPAIMAWRAHGLGAGVPDTSVTISHVDIPGEGRYYYGYKVRDLGNGSWRYEYAIYNLNGHRSASSFSIPTPAGSTITNIGFSAPFYHSGELYSNAAWINTNCTAGTMCWQSPQTFSENANTNALRWGTMYNFWFDASTAPTSGTATMGLFRPPTAGSPATSVTLDLQVPSAGFCYANCDNSNQAPTLNVADFTCFLQRYAAGESYANCDNSTEPPVLNVADFTCFLESFAAGCQ
jgi:hypothetical protein